MSESIRIGTMIRASALSEQAIADSVRQRIPLGFESFELDFWQTLGSIDLKRLADRVGEALSDSDAVISCIGLYGNPLGDSPEDEATRLGLEKCIDAAPLFGCDLITCWTGRVAGTPVPENIPPFKKIFTPLVSRAAENGVRIGFENWGNGWETGTWNIALSPTAWELIFDALPSENVGLEWEPCHQLKNGLDPLAQLRTWAGKIFHLHGKDAAGTTARFPGLGDSDWSRIISELKRAAFDGAINIEGWHDPIFRDELEMTGQVNALRFLKSMRSHARPVACPIIGSANRNSGTLCT